jgi:hypothetical protein
VADPVYRSVGITALLALVLGMGAAGAQIQVEVNERPVKFGEVGAVREAGRVLIPLRAVGEELGATIRWNAALRTVFGERGERRFELPVGQRQAVLDGRPVTLDVPAQMIRGTTMVPLRFVAEALGAEVAWDGAGSRVLVTTSGSGGAPAAQRPPPEVRVASFRHDASGPLTAGSAVTVILAGTPGGQATFDLGSIARDVPMAEERAEPGRYVGRYVIPAGITEREVPLIARLRVGATDAPLIQAGTPLVIDSQPPVVASAAPADGSIVRNQRPNIYAEFSDAGGTGLDIESVRMRVNGADVTLDARVTPGFVIYTPEALPEGPVSVSVEAKDRAGNRMQKVWKFTVASPLTLIESITHDAQKSLGAGDVVTVEVRGQPGGRATFSISGVASSLPMTEPTPGSYLGRYTVRRGDQQLRAEVAVTLVMPDGERQTLAASAPLRIATRELRAPTVTSPGPDDPITSPVVVTGRGEPGAKVVVEVTYAARAFGVLPINGTAATQEVTVAADGTFKTEPMSLRLPRGATKVEYAIRVASPGIDGDAGTTGAAAPRTGSGHPISLR